MTADEGTLRAAVEALADWLDSERDSIREAYLQHNAGRAEGRPVKRPDLATWGNAYEVAGRKVREVMSRADDVSVDRQAVVAEALAVHEHEYERRCYPAHACSCGEWDGAFDDDGGPADGQNDTADAYRAHAAAAVLAALDTPPALSPVRVSPGGPTAADQVTAARAVADEAAADLRARFVAREELYQARDALYRGEGPDLVADADIVYGEWLGNRADALKGAPP